MDDTIEICSGCGKMPRSIDNISGYFLCTRCGNRATTHVTGDDYEKTVTELDRKFHEMLLKQRHEAVSKEPLRLPKAKKAPAKAAKAKAAKK
ncbi:hypothetical protein H0O00_04000, partial [Candidatus Micrarchaeota archaeon]|nr:hypothetical protein [Candidatus Micrarchaeota archaeon]